MGHSGSERVHRTLQFSNPGALPVDFPAPWGSDFFWTGMSPSPDYRPQRGVDEWGAVWENIGVCNLGEVKDFPLKDWWDFDRLRIPDITEPQRWEEVALARQSAHGRFILGTGISIYERVHFLRGLENTWTDIYAAREELCRLIDILVGMNLAAIERYAASGVEGLFLLDDWGLQDRLMIDPDVWRVIWLPRYTRIFDAAHAAGLTVFLHSCGYILDILEDLIAAGLDVIQLDQQENMGLETLGQSFGGRVTFFCPVDIQKTMARGVPEEIRAYCRKMVEHLARPGGGFMPRWYADPQGAGHSRESIRAMCEEFLAINSEREGQAR